MKRVTDAYTSALFPSRYGALGTAREQDGYPMGIAADTLDLSIAALAYRVVSAVEGLPAIVRRRALASDAGTHAARRPPAATPVGCG